MSLGDRIEAMRRLGGTSMVVCSQCRATMRQPADPFEGRNVIWWNDNLYHVCTSGCHDRLRARLKAGKDVDDSTDRLIEDLQRTSRRTRGANRER